MLIHYVLLACMAGILKCEQKLANSWVLKLDAEPAKAAEIAHEHHFKIVKRIDLSRSSGLYVVQPDHVRLRRSLPDHTFAQRISEAETRLAAHPAVQSLERELVKVRNKRDFVPQFHNYALHRQEHLYRNQRQFGQMQLRRSFFGKSVDEDPQWADMWYMNRNMYSPDLPDMNVTSAWAQGYSGRGVSVTFLDDGLEHTHPDIHQNYDPKASDDINENDRDPLPRYEATDENKHGTRCAGEVAAVANNSICSVGVAFNAGIGGIRMLDGDVTDSVEARSLVFNRDHISIYSASWGPDDNGEVVDGPGPLTKQAFEEGALYGRKGLGSIFVWASGNGGRFNDSCACDGYANSIYTLSISSTSENSNKPWYLEECTSTLATTYSSGDERLGEREIATTDIRHKCTTKHTGTSAAAPIAAGIIALALEANSKLTWRDVMYLTVITSRPKAIKSNNFITNKRGFQVSSRYGFGLMDAGRMVELAKDWVTVPPLKSCHLTDSNFKTKPGKQNNMVEATLYTNGCFKGSDEVNFMEQVEITVSIETQLRGMLEIYLTSPMGTTTLILPRRNRDRSNEGFNNWTFMTVQLWGESPRGDWKLLVTATDGSPVSLKLFTLVIHGTKEKPVEYDKQLPHMKASTCHYECNRSAEMACYGPTQFECASCAHYSLQYESEKIKCVSYCPSGYYADKENKICSQCSPECLECDGNSASDCTSCIDLLHDQKCVSKCPEGFFANSQMKCEACSDDCLTCEHEATNCLECRNRLALPINSCLMTAGSCEAGTYYDITVEKCRDCDITCGECYAGMANNCVSCLEKRPHLNEGECMARCPSQHFVGSAGNCFKCASSCMACEADSFNCSRCKPGFRLDEHSKCRPIVLTDNECAPNCTECHGKLPNECNVCSNGLVYLDGACVETAPAGYLKKLTIDSRGERFIASKCTDGCILCINDDDSCINCDQGFKLNGNRCIADCKPKFYADSTGICRPCESSCNECINATACTSCAKGRWLLDNKCIDSCPLNYYSSPDFKCIRCYPSCESCDGVKKTNCLNCTTGYSYFNGKCESKCPAGTYHNAAEDLCVLCDSDRCATCITSATSCTSCMPPLSLDEVAFRCTSATTLAVENIPHNNSKHFLVLGVSLLTFLVAAAFIVFSIVKFLNLNSKAKTSTMSYNKVEYSPLHDTLDIS